MEYEEVNQEMAMLNGLFDEVSGLNDLLKKTPSDVFKNYDPDTKWEKNFATNDSSFSLQADKHCILNSNQQCAVGEGILPCFRHCVPNRVTALVKVQPSPSYKWK